MPRKLFREPSHNTCVESIYTPEELVRKNRIEALKKQREEITEQLRTVLAECLDNHLPEKRLFFDVEGFPYDVRHCAICNARLETI